MIDMLKISIPFKAKHLLETTVFGQSSVAYVDIQECSRRGVSLEAKSVSFTRDDVVVGDLRHPYESLPTSYTGMAFKIFHGTPNRAACVELKASPAKIIQGHNVYGSTSIELGALEMLSSLMYANPDFYDMLDVSGALLDSMDCTFSARVKSSEQVRQVIQQLKNVSHKQMRTAVRNEHETTCYFSKGSRHVDRKAYSKGDEFKRQLNDLKAKAEKGDHSYDRVIDVMSDPKLQNFARYLVRFEASAKRRYLDEFKVPRRLFDAINFQKEYEINNNSLIIDIWKKAFKPLMEALEGQRMNIYNDEEVHNALKMLYGKITPKGNISYAKADRIFRFYRSLISDGYDSVFSSFSKSNKKSFYNQLNPLLDAGFSKAQLQNLKGDGMDNVVPLLQVIEIDFQSQRPSDWVEPIPPVYTACAEGDYEKLSNIVKLKVA